MYNSAERILELAALRGVSLEFLNDLIGGYYGKTKGWKNGTVKPTFNEIKTIANYFNVSLDYLLGHSAIPEPPVTPPGAPASMTAGIPVADAVPAASSAPAGDSYIFLTESDGRSRKIVVPPDKVERLVRLLEAGLPELMR